MIIEYINDSILNAEQYHILHGVNCQNKMGSGVAKVLYEKYPEVKQKYHEDNEYVKKNVGYYAKLGDTRAIPCEDKIVHNCYTQDYYGYDGKKYVSYDAIYEVFQRYARSNLKEVAIPKIGAGLAGGNWNIISQIIDDATGDDLDVYVYYLKD